MDNVKILVNWLSYGKYEENDSNSDACSYELLDEEMERMVVFFTG